MNKIQTLIQQHCPNGVEFKTLGEVCRFQRGTIITAKNAVAGNVPVIAGGQTPAYYHNVANRTGETISVSSSGAYAGFVAFWNIPIFMSDSFSVHPNPELLLPKYLFYFLKNIQEKIYHLKKGAGIPHVHGSDLANCLIPIPPLAVQQEIVAILDKFTELEAELEVELEAELKARRKQYEYYRNKLLTFDETAKDVQWMRLGEIASYSNNRINASLLSNENYVGVDNLLQNKQGKTNSNYVPGKGNLWRFEKDDILIGNIRPYLKKIWKADRLGGTNGDVLVIRIHKNYRDHLTSEFLYYLLASDDFFDYDMQNSKGTKMPRGDKAAVMKFPIPIPPLAEQARIVAILDKFDALVNDLSIGLPAEIAARRKQYEYYRNQLLCFDEIAGE